MPAVSVLTTTTEIVAADPDNWRQVWLSKDATANPVYVNIGAAATTNDYRALLATASDRLGWPIQLPPGQALNGIATTAAVTVNYLVI